MLSLYEKIELLCKRESINITEMCKRSGASRGSLTDLKKGRKKTLTAETLAKIANYFQVSVDYLLTGEESAQKETPALTEKDEREITFDDFTYAFLDESKELTEENKQKLLEMAKFFKQQQEKDT